MAEQSEDLDLARVPQESTVASPTNVETRREGDGVFFDFACPGCGAEGELGLLISDGMKPFACPEGCGSMFVMWQPNHARYFLRCVVQMVREHPTPESKEPAQTEQGFTGLTNES